MSSRTLLTSNKMPSAAQQKKFAAKVKEQLHLRDLNITVLARDLGCHRNSVKQAVHRGRCPHVHRRLCEILGLHPIL